MNSLNQEDDEKEITKKIENYVIDERGDYGKTDAENIITVLKNIL